MSTVWRTMKVFISSTFLDMELARDRLAHVFYEMEKNVLDRQLTIIPYDLRWRERLSNEPVADWCMKMVEDCRYFIGILGNRYGWRPPMKSGGMPNAEHISITEMEIDRALKTVDKQNRFFCFGDFQGEGRENEADVASLQSLKERLRKSGETIYVCRDVAELLAIISRELANRLDRQFPPGQKVEPIAYTYEQGLSEIVEEKIRQFVDRVTYLQQLEDFALASEKPNYLGIYALAGNGKSALVARFIKNWAHPDIPIVAHFMSMGGDAKDVTGIMTNIGERLQRLGIIKNSLEADPLALSRQIQNALQETKQRMVLIIDGLDEIHESGRNLSWLPRVLPAHIRVVLTTRPVETWDTLQTYPHLRPLELPSLNDKEVDEIINAYSQRYKLNLSADDGESLRKRAAGNPLYLKVALDEICTAGVAVGQLALSVQSLFDQILKRLQARYGEEIVHRYLGLIAAGRVGLTENELQELLNVGSELVSLNKALSNFIITRRGFLDFFHPEFERNIMIRMGKSGMRNYHGALAAYFAQKGYGYARALEELPYQLQESENYAQLLRVLTDMEFLEAKCNAGMITGLNQDFDYALYSLVVPVPQDIKVTAASGTEIGRETIRLLSRALAINIQFLRSHPASLFQMLWNYGYWYDCPQAAKHYQTTAQTAQLPWLRKQEKFYALVESWRRVKEGKKGFVWLKSLHPLPVLLDFPLINIFRGHDKSIYSLNFSSNGGKVVSGSWDGTVRIWDSKTGELLYTLKGHEDAVRSVEFSADGTRIASASWDGTIRIWDAEAGVMLRTLSAQGKKVNSVAFSKDGHKVLGGFWDRTLRIWEVQSGKLLHTLGGHDSLVNSAAFSNDGKKIVSGSLDNTVRIWNGATGDLLYTLTGHDKGVNSVRFSKDDHKIISASEDGTIKIWEVANGKLLRTLSGHKNAVKDAAFSPDGKRLVSASVDKTIRIWEADSGKLLGVLPGHEGEVNSVEFSPDGLHIASGSADKTIRIWDALKTEMSYTPCGHHDAITTLQFMGDSGKVISGSTDGNIHIWDTATGEITKTLESGKAVNDLALSPKGDKIICGAADNVLRIWDTKTGKLLYHLTGHEDAITQVAVSPDGGTILSGSADKSLRMWNMQTGNLVHTLTGHADKISCAEFSKDGNKVASGSWDETVRIWDVKAGKLLHALSGHVATVSCVKFSQDGNKIASASYDQTIRIWDVNTGELLHALSGHQKYVNGLLFSADGTKLISCSRDHTMRVWDTQSGECLKTISGQGNMQAMLEKSTETTYQALAQEVETVVEDTRQEKPVAFFPGTIKEIALSKNILIGYVENYVYILSVS